VAKRRQIRDNLIFVFRLGEQKQAITGSTRPPESVGQWLYRLFNIFEEAASYQTT